MLIYYAGIVAGTEIVQLYIRDKVSTVEPQLMELKDFAWINLKAGEFKTISFTIDRNKLEYWTLNKKIEVEPGEFELMIDASYRMGAESKDEFSELFTPTEESGELLGQIIYFHSKDTGKPVKYVAPSYALKDINKIPLSKAYSFNPIPK